MIVMAAALGAPDRAGGKVAPPEPGAVVPKFTLPDVYRRRRSLDH
jgi:hypothetical protein